SILKAVLNPLSAPGELIGISGLIFEDPIPGPDPQPAVGDLVMYGVAGQEAGQYLVTRIEPGPELSAIITMVDYAPAVYDADADPPAHDPRTRALPPGSAPLILSYRSDDGIAERMPDGSIGARIQVTLGLPGGTSGSPGYPLAIQPQFRRSASNGTADRGAWNNVTAYFDNDTVTHNGSTWEAIDASANIEPGSDGSVWVLLNQNGPWTIMLEIKPAAQIFLEPVEPG